MISILFPFDTSVVVSVFVAILLADLIKFGVRVTVLAIIGIRNRELEKELKIGTR